MVSPARPMFSKQLPNFPVLRRSLHKHLAEKSTIHVLCISRIPSKVRIDSRTQQYSKTESSITMSRIVPNNSIIHMTIFGIAIGAGVGVLTMLGLMVISLSETPNYPLVSLATTAFFSLYFGLTMGGVSGAVIGVLDGVLVKLLLRNAEFPLQPEAKKKYYRRVNITIGVVTAVYTLLVLLIGAGFFLIHMLIPALLASAGMVYGVRFFLARWQAYTGLVEQEIYTEDPERTAPSGKRSTQIYPAVGDFADPAQPTMPQPEADASSANPLGELLGDNGRD